MEVMFLLDFDGVLFNSAHEAFLVSKRTVEGRKGFRQDVDYEEFLAYRSVVTDAWQYNRLFSEDRPISLLKGSRLVEPEEHDWDFSRRFFAVRKEMMEDVDWPKAMPPYDFFLRLKPILLEQPERFAILSTRNVQSIRQTHTKMRKPVMRNRNLEV